jgi:hypothetical protein
MAHRKNNSTSFSSFYHLKQATHTHIYIYIYIYIFSSEIPKYMPRMLSVSVRKSTSDTIQAKVDE